MERGRGAIETDIAGDARRFRQGIERLRLRHLVNEPAGREHVEEIGLVGAHARSLGRYAWIATGNWRQPRVAVASFATKPAPVEPPYLFATAASSRRRKSLPRGSPSNVITVVQPLGNFIV